MAKANMQFLQELLGLFGQDSQAAATWAQRVSSAASPAAAERIMKAARKAAGSPAGGIAGLLGAGVGGGAVIPPAIEGTPNGAGAVAGAGSMLSRLLGPAIGGISLGLIGLPYVAETKSERENRKLQREAMRNQSLATAMLLQSNLNEQARDRNERMTAGYAAQKMRAEDMAFAERQAGMDRLLAAMTGQFGTAGALSQSTFQPDRSGAVEDAAMLAAQTRTSSVWDALGIR